jgi:hypothetical protein
MSRARKKTDGTDMEKVYIAVLILASLTIVAAYAIKTGSPEKSAENIPIAKTAENDSPTTTGSTLVQTDKQSGGSSCCGSGYCGSPSVNASEQQIMAVEDVISRPEDFIGSSIIIRGTVVNSYPLKQLFTMGCSCKNIPVKYGGILPDKGGNVVAYGSVKNASGGYIFEAENIK